MITAEIIAKLSDGSYVLEDTTGNKITVSEDAIINAVKNNKINITNITITNDKISLNKPAEPYTSVAQYTPSQTETTSSEQTDDISRIHYLVKILNEARMVYEQGTDEIMSNYEYDRLYDELEALEKKTGTVLSNSPTVNVGYEVVSELPKKRHSKPMLSLAKTKDRNELIRFLQGKEGVLSWKLDGLTVVLTYENGDLVEAVTRGNGTEGELVTNNAKQFVNVPRHIAFKGRLVMRGEAIITYSSFEKINATIFDEDEKYKNPRNLCSGSVRQLDSKVTAQRNVEWKCFQIVECDAHNLNNDYADQLETIKTLGFEVVDYAIVNASNINSVMDNFERQIESGKLDIPSDGLVLTFRDIKYGESLGVTAKSPRHSIAFKWEDETEVTQIEGIEWSPSRTGLINPVALFKPVFLDGSTISRASVHNVSIFAELELGYGDRVEVYKANKIIPQIAENLDRTGSCEIPGSCPCCGCETEIREDPKSGVLTLWCPNPECEAKENRLYKHFVSRDAMNIDGISISKLTTFAEYGIIDDIASIFRIEDHKNEIIQIEGFGLKSYNNMIEAINKARNVKLTNLIYALGIPNIGLATSKVICKYFNYDLTKTVTASFSELCMIDGIGEVIAQSFVDYFSNKDNVDVFMRLLKEVNIIPEKVSENTSMQGVTICVTGDVYIFPNRRAVKEIVENMGGKLTGSVSRSTTYLVTNDTTSGSNKNRKAQEYGIPILTEKEFIDKFNIEI